jgi:hypothetical protein
MAKIRRAGLSLAPGNFVGEVLTWDGSQWGPQAIPAGSVPPPVGGDILIYNSVLQLWQPGDAYVRYLQAQPGTTTLQGIGIPVLSNHGVTTSQVPVATDYSTSLPHNTDANNGDNQPCGYASSPGASICCLGGSGTVGGFKVRIRFKYLTLPASCRSFVGIKLDSPFINNPSTAFHTLGVGFDDGQTTWRFVHNDGVGAAPMEVVGVGVAPALSTVYDVEISSDPGGANVQIRLFSVVAGGRTLIGSILPILDLPGGTVMLSPAILLNRTVAAPIAIGFYNCLITTL